jgi:Ras-related protein Rab-1A
MGNAGGKKKSGKKGAKTENASSGGTKTLASNSEYDKLFRILMAGDLGVGKSCVVLRFTENFYSDTPISTIGDDFKTKTFDVRGAKIKMQIWDTAGQEKFRSIITSSYYRGSHGVLMVFDITNRASFEGLDKWFEQIKTYGSPDTTILIVGNKTDLNSQRAVSEQEIKDYCARQQVEYVEMSAKDNAGVEQGFIRLGELIHARQNE